MNTDTDKFIGTWKLISFEARSDNSETLFPMGQRPVGRLIYDDKGNMSVLLANADPPPMSPDVSLKSFASLEEKGQAFDSFEAYFGAYVVDETENVITHHIEGALFTNWTGSSQKRFYSFMGNRLELSTPPIKHEDLCVVMLLLWERA